MHRILRRCAAPAVLAGLLVVAFLLRIYGLDWDRGHYFHPDERQILMVASALSWPRDPLLVFSASSPLNPRFFAYGSFPIYLLRGLSALAGRCGCDWALANHSVLLGRLLSVFFDTLSVLATYLLGGKVFGQRVGLLGALCVSLTVLHLQLAHFYTADPLLTALILLAVNKALAVARRGRPRDGACLGLLMGTALATKVSVLPLVAVALVAWLAFAWPSRPHRGDAESAQESETNEVGSSGLSISSAVLSVMRRLRAASAGLLPWPPGRSPHTMRSFLNTLDPQHALWALWMRARRGMLVTFGVMVVCFVLLQPYALIDAYSFVLGIGQEIAMAQGWYDFPYTRQYAGTWGYLYQIRQILLFAMGLPLGVLGLSGLVWLGWRVWRRPWREGVVLLTWPLLYALMQGATYAKFIRYMLPLLPFLCVAGAAMWVAIWDATGVQPASRGRQSARAAEDEDAPHALGTGQQARYWRAGALGMPRSPSRQRRLRWLWLAMLVVIIASAMFYAIAFLNVYRQPHPWLQATAWLCENAPAGSTILTEYWDDPLPQGGPANRGGCPLTYSFITMDFHTLDTGARLEELLDAIEASDYIVLSSQRLYAALPRSPQYFPLATRYYQQLFAQHLGFHLAAAPAVYPQWAGVTLLDNPRAGLPLTTPPLLAASRPSGCVLNLGQADESFTVYDHPQPLIFARVERVSRAALESLIAAQDKIH